MPPTSDDRLLSHDPLLPRTGGLYGASSGGGPPADPDGDETDGPRPAPGDEPRDGNAKPGDGKPGDDKPGAGDD